MTLLLGTLAARTHDADGWTANALNTMVLRYALPLSLFAGITATQCTTLLAQLPLAGMLASSMIVPFALPSLSPATPFGETSGRRAASGGGVLALALPAASMQIILAVREGVAERERHPSCCSRSF